MPSTMRWQGNASSCALCKCDLERARSNLSRSGKAAGRRINDGQFFRLNAAVARDLFDDHRRRRAAAFQDQGSRSRPYPRNRAPRTAFLSARVPARARSQAKKAFLPSPWASFQPAYWLARQAMTGLEERVASDHGQRAPCRSGTRPTVPRPPMQISATSKPAAMLPGCWLPASIRVSPSSPRVTPILSDGGIGNQPFDQHCRAGIHAD